MLVGKQSFNRKSLHAIGNIPNPYEQAISIIGRTLSPFDEDNLIPCFGFGDGQSLFTTILPVCCLPHCCSNNSVFLLFLLQHQHTISTCSAFIRIDTVMDLRKLSHVIDKSFHTLSYQVWNVSSLTLFFVIEVIYGQLSVVFGR